MQKLTEKQIDLRNFSFDSKLLSLFPAQFAYDKRIVPLWQASLYTHLTRVIIFAKIGA
jgi:hypothetical protein